MGIVSRFVDGFKLTNEERAVIEKNRQHNGALDQKIEQGYNTGRDTFVSTAKGVRGIITRLFHGTTHAFGVSARVIEKD